MKRPILIHNPRCSKSRSAKEILIEAGIEFDTIDYLKDGLKEKLLKKLPSLLKLSYIEMIRTKEEKFFELGLKDKKFSSSEWVNILIENPILLERPIFINGDKAIIGRPPELVKTLF